MQSEEALWELAVSIEFGRHGLYRSMSGFHVRLKGAINGNRLPSRRHRSKHTYSINTNEGSYCKLTEF